MPNPTWVVGGPSPNPAGRPKKERSLTALLEQRADRERLVDTLLEMAYDGDLTAIKLVLERIDGLPAMRTEQEQAWAAQEKQVLALMHDCVEYSLGWPVIRARLIAEGTDEALIAQAEARLDTWARQELQRRRAAEPDAPDPPALAPWRDAVEAAAAM